METLHEWGPAGKSLQDC
jgi:hypothetical protein